MLFLDRISEFDRHTLDALCEVLKEGVARISRAGRTAELPARFQMVGTIPPSACEETVGGNRCSQSELERHHDRVPQPLRDRFDMTVRVERTPGSVPAGRVPAEDSGAGRARVCRARDRQAERWDSGSGTTNADFAGAQLRRQCRLDTAGLTLVERATQRLGLADDGFDRIVRVARTIADLDDAADIRQVHVAEACQYVGAAHPAPVGRDGRHAS